LRIPGVITAFASGKVAVVALVMLRRRRSLGIVIVSVAALALAVVVVVAVVLVRRHRRRLRLALLRRDTIVIGSLGRVGRAVGRSAVGIERFSLGRVAVLTVALHGELETTESQLDSATASE
jgi:hypothetical protein